LTLAAHRGQPRQRVDHEGEHEEDEAGGDQGRFVERVGGASLNSFAITAASV